MENFSLNNQADRLLKTLSLDKKVALLQSAGWLGNTPLKNEAARNLLFNRKIGAFTLYDYNLETAGETAQMVKEIMIEAGKQGNRFSIFNIDAEGGRLYTNVKGATLVPGNMALGAIATSDLPRAVRLAYEQGRMIAKELRSWGATWVLAPVIDVNSNPMNPVIGIRSVGEDKKTVAEVTSALIRGFQKEGVAATVKHAPDHGDTAFDTHTGMSVDLRRREDISGIYVLQKTIEAGVAAIMPSHMAYPRAFPDPKGPKIKFTLHDPKNPTKTIDMEATPATLSPTLLTDFFRKTLNFQGLIITDALEMGAIINYFGIGYAALLALEAGADMFIAGADPAILEKIWQEKFSRSYTQEDQLEPQRVILRAAKEGIVTKGYKNGHKWVSEEVLLSSERQKALLKRIDESARRVLTFQIKWGLRTPPDPARANVVVGSKTHQKLSEEIAEGAVTLLKASHGESFKYLSPTTEVVVVRPQYEQLTPSDSAYKLGFTLFEKIKKYHPYTHGVVVLKPLPKEETRLERDSRLRADAALMGEKQPDVQVVRGIKSVLAQVKEADVLVIETYFGHQSDFQRKLLESLFKTGKRVVHLIVGNPYDAMVSAKRADIIMIGYAPCVTEAMIKALFEEILPKGRLPVTIPEVAKRGDGLAQFPTKAAIAFESYRKHISQLATAALAVSLLAFPLMTYVSSKTQTSHIQSVPEPYEHAFSNTIKIAEVDQHRIFSYSTLSPPHFSERLGTLFKEFAEEVLKVVATDRYSPSRRQSSQ